MEYRNWNNKPLRTSLLGYGCMRFPTRADGSIDEPRAEALLNTAKAAGVNYFDVGLLQLYFQGLDFPLELIK